MENNFQPSRLVSIAIIGSIVGLGLFLIGGLVLAGEYWWRGRPEYSINQIGVAVRTHNLNLFRKHVDTRSVSGRLVDDITTASSRPARSDSERAGQAWGQGLIALLKPQLVELFETEIERYVETGTFNTDQSQGEVSKGFHDLSQRVGPYDWATIDGNVATTAVTIRTDAKDKAPLKLGLKLRRTEDGYWQLMEVSLPRELLENMQGRP
jgi:hypothetical protein